MHKISYTCTNKSKVILYLMIMASFILRLILVGEIHFFKLEGYEVYLLPTIVYYFIIFAIVTFLFFGYKFFYTLYDDTTITYYNLIMNKSHSMKFEDIEYAHFGKRGISLYSKMPKENEKPDLYIPFFRLGVPEAISVNNFFIRLIDDGTMKVKKDFTILPGYTKMWQLLAPLYALISFCVLITCAEPLYSVILLYLQFK